MSKWGNDLQVALVLHQWLIKWGPTEIALRVWTTFCFMEDNTLAFFEKSSATWISHCYFLLLWVYFITCRGRCLLSLIFLIGSYSLGRHLGSKISLQRERTLGAKLEINGMFSLRWQTEPLTLELLLSKPHWNNNFEETKEKEFMAGRSTA